MEEVKDETFGKYFYTKYEGINELQAETSQAAASQFGSAPRHIL